MQEWFPHATGSMSASRRQRGRKHRIPELPKSGHICTILCFEILLIEYLTGNLQEKKARSHKNINRIETTSVQTQITPSSRPNPFRNKSS